MCKLFSKNYLLLILIIGVHYSSVSQVVEEIDHCHVTIKITKTIPDLNGDFQMEYRGNPIEYGGFINGMKHGEWVTYNIYGTRIRSINYNVGILHGPVKFKYANGKDKLIGEFDNGRKVGKWIYCNKKGRHICEGSYENNKPVGIWVIYNKRGKRPIIEFDFDKGQYLLQEEISYLEPEKVINCDNSAFRNILFSRNVYTGMKTQPFGGFNFADYLLSILMEVPIYLGDTNFENEFYANISIGKDNTSEVYLQTSNSRTTPNIKFTNHLRTNDDELVKKVTRKPSDIQLRLLQYKFIESLSMLPPWIYKYESEVDLTFHYLLNKDLPCPIEYRRKLRGYRTRPNQIRDYTFPIEEYLPKKQPYIPN